MSDTCKPTAVMESNTATEDEIDHSTERMKLNCSTTERINGIAQTVQVVLIFTSKSSKMCSLRRDLTVVLATRRNS